MQDTEVQDLQDLQDNTNVRGYRGNRGRGNYNKVWDNDNDNKPNFVQLNSQDVTINTEVPKLPKDRPKPPSLQLYNTEIDNIDKVIKDAKYKLSLLNKEYKNVEQQQNADFFKKYPEVNQLNNRLYIFKDTRSKYLSEMKHMKDDLANQQNQQKFAEESKPEKLKLERNKDMDLSKILKELKDIDHSIQHTSITLKEEKKLVKRAAELEALKPLVPSAHNQSEQSKSIQKDAFELRNKMKENYEAVSKLNEDINQIQNKLDKQYLEKEKDKEEQISKMGNVNLEKSQLKELITNEYVIRKERISLQNREEQAHKEYSRQQKYVEWLKRHIDWLKREDYRKFKSEEYEKAEKLKNPNENNIIICQRLMNHIENLINERNKKIEEESKKIVDVNEFDEEKLNQLGFGEGSFTIKKKERDYEPFQIKKQNKNKKRSKNKNPTDSTVNQSINHTIEVINQFGALEIKLPNSINQLIECLPLVKSKKEEFESFKAPEEISIINEENDDDNENIDDLK